MRWIIKAFKLNKKDFLIAGEATILLLLSRLGIMCFPYKLYRPFLGKQMKKGRNRTVDEEIVCRVSFWIHKAAACLPLECSCLPQALTGKFMLNRRGIESTLSLGLGKDENNKLFAHAWLTVNDVPVTGGKDNSTLARVAHFK